MKGKKMILGARDANGNVIPLEKLMQNKKKYLALHYHPNAIRHNVSDFLETMKKDGSPQDLQYLFEDIKVLVNWALDKMPIVKPPKDEK